MVRTSLYEITLCLVFISSVVPQETSLGRYEIQDRPLSFFFPEARRPATNNNQTLNENQMTSTSSSTISPQHTTQKEFTGIAFPPQVFEIITGNEPTTQNLGGRKNATLIMLMNATEFQQPFQSQSEQSNQQSQQSHQQSQQQSQQPHQQQQTPLNSTQVPDIINGATRPPTRFPTGNNNKPSPRPTTTTTYGFVQQNPNYHVRPQAGSIAAAPSLLLSTTTTTPAPDNRVGQTTSRIPTVTNPSRPRPTFYPTTTSTTIAPHPSSIGSLQGSQIAGMTSGQASSTYKEVLRSIRGVNQFLQETLMTPTSSGGMLWDGFRSNFLVSPLSVGLTMAQMLMAGGARAKSHLRDILRIYAKSEPNEQQFRSEVVFHKTLGELVRSMQRYDPSMAINPVWNRGSNPSHPYTLAVDSAIFVQTGLAVRPTFIHSIETIYSSRFHPLDFRRDPFGSMNAINRWAEEVSRGKIKNFLSAPPSPNTAAHFTSSLYFKAVWRNPFNEPLTSLGEFRVTPQESINAYFMKGEVNNGSKFIDSNKFGVKGVRLAYNDTDEVAMYLFLPKNETANIQEFAKRLLRPSTKSLNQRYDGSNFPPNKNFQDPLPSSWEIHKQVSASPVLITRTDVPAETNDRWELEEIISAMKDKSVVLTIPKVTLRGSIKLHPPVSGGKDQLTGMLEDSSQALGANSVGAIIHETVLELTESGTEAAAITSGIIEYQGGVATFKADRPFMVLLRHELTGMPLFWGAVCRPFFRNN